MRPTLQYDPVTGKPVFPWTARGIIIHDRWQVGACPCAFTGWAVGGACCSECAAGRACPSEVAGVVERARPWGDAEKLDASIRTFQGEVTRRYKEWPSPPSQDQGDFLQTFTRELEDWRGWYDAAKARRDSPGLGDFLRLGAMMDDTTHHDLPKFEGFETRFAEYLRRWRDGLHEQTSVKPPDPRSPIDRATDSVKKALPWIAAGGALLVLGPYLAPVIGALAVKAVRP